MLQNVGETVAGVYTTISKHGDYISITVRRGSSAVVYSIDPITKIITKDVREFQMTAGPVEIQRSKIDDPVVFGLLTDKTINDLLTEHEGIVIDGYKAAQR